MTASGAGAGPDPAAPGGRAERALLLLGVVTLAVSLRPAVTSLGAVLGMVRDDLAVPGWLAGVLTTLPVLSFAAVGSLTHLLTSRLGVHRTALLALLAVAVGSGGRALADSPAAFTLGSAVALAGMAVGNVSLPPLVKLHFPDRISSVTAVYSCALLAGAALPAGLTVPVADAAGTWRWGLGVWAVAAAVAALPWLGLLRHDVRDSDPLSTLTPRMLVRSRLAWVMAIFFGTQSAQAYAQFGWLPTIYTDAGLSESSAALMLTVVALVGVPAPLVLPAYARATSDHRPLVVVFACVTLVGWGGLIVSATTVPWLWAVLLGIGGCAFPWVLAMLALRTRTAEGTAALSGFAQSTGYLLAAVGPLGAGLLHDASGGWTVPLVVLMVLTVPLLWTGLLFARPRMLEDELEGVGPR